MEDVEADDYYGDYDVGGLLKQNMRYNGYYEELDRKSVVNTVCEWIKEDVEKEISDMQDVKSSDKFYSRVAQLFRDAKRKMSILVNMVMVYSYYEAGRMIIDEEQNGSERAAYGKYILQELSSRLTQ